MLVELEGLLDGLLELPAHRLHERLAGPTLIHLPGREPAPLLIAVLLHGNEETGWEAVRRVLTARSGSELPRALSLFIGNVAAAAERVRRLPDQADYNRIWNGGVGAEQVMAERVVERMAARNLFASIDLHNNTGLNPHYACINRLEHPFLHLATLFSRTIVHFVRPDTVQSMAFSRICPAVTVECGKPGQEYGIERAAAFIDAVLHLTDFPRHPVPVHDYDLFHTVATVKVPPNITFGFDDASDLSFPADLDELNFTELPAGTLLAAVNHPGAALLTIGENGESLSEHYFELADGELRTRVPVMPSMLTLDERVIRQDCLCYLMERLPPLVTNHP